MTASPSGVVSSSTGVGVEISTGRGKGVSVMVGVIGTEVAVIVGGIRVWVGSAAGDPGDEQAADRNTTPKNRIILFNLLIEYTQFTHLL